MSKIKYIEYSFGLQNNEIPTRIQTRRLDKICNSTDKCGLLKLNGKTTEKSYSIFYLMNDKNILRYIKEYYPEIYLRRRR